MATQYQLFLISLSVFLNLNPTSLQVRFHLRRSTKKYTIGAICAKPFNTPVVKENKSVIVSSIIVSISICLLDLT